MQIRLRDRGAGLLSLMAERERRRPQDQAAILIEQALEAWAEQEYPAVYQAPDDAVAEET